MEAENLLRRLLEETERPLALAEAELKSAQETVARIQAERYGLELALARHLGRPAPRQVDAADEGGDEWRRLNRSDAAERVLAEAGMPLHRKEIVARLHSHGREDSLNHVSAALAYLGQKERVLGRGQGVWVHRDHELDRLRSDDGALDVPRLDSESSTENDPAATGSFSGSLEKGEPSDDHHSDHRGYP